MKRSRKGGTSAHGLGRGLLFARKQGPQMRYERPVARLWYWSTTQTANATESAALAAARGILPGERTQYHPQPQPQPQRRHSASTWTATAGDHSAGIQPDHSDCDPAARPGPAPPAPPTFTRLPLPFPSPAQPRPAASQPCPAHHAPRLAPRGGGGRRRRRD